MMFDGDWPPPAAPDVFRWTAKGFVEILPPNPSTRPTRKEIERRRKATKAAKLAKKKNRK